MDTIDLAGLRILVADDEPFNLSLAGKMLRDLGCTDLVTAESGDEALRVLDADDCRPAAAILDFNMPGATGLQILWRLRCGELAASRDTKVLMLTGSSDFGLVGAAMALDVDAFIVKPASRQTLAARLGKALEQPAGLKCPADYAAIDVEAVCRRLLSQKPAVKAKAPARKAAPNGVPVRLDAVAAGAILSEDVRGRAGELLLGKATRLDERLILRLQELQGVLDLDIVHVFPATAASQAVR